MDIQKKKVSKDKTWSVAAKTAALASLGLTAGLGLGACSKEEPEPIIFGDVGTDLTVSVTVRDDSTDSTKTDSTSVIESSGAKAALDSICVRRNTSSGITPKIPLRSEESAPLTGMVSTISTKRFPPKNPAYDVAQKLSQMKGRKTPLMGKAATNKSKPVPLGGVPRAPEPNEK